MTENIRIRSLAERPELAPVLAEWFRKEWPDTFRTWPVERVVAEYFTPATMRACRWYSSPRSTEIPSPP